MLYTGDFRWEVTSKITEMGKNMLLSALNNHKVDTLYIDDTYCNPSYSFPSREVAAQQVVNIINSYPEHDTIIGRLIRERGFIILHLKHAETKDLGWPERLQTMHILGLHDNFTIEVLEGLNTMRPTIGIMPSGLPWALKKNKSSCGLSSMKTVESMGSLFLDLDTGNRYRNKIEKQHEYMYTVAYSDHSCFTEIVEFVKFICPTHMKGIVSSSSSYVDPCYHLPHIYGTSSLYEKYMVEVDSERVEGRCKSDEKLKRKRIKQYHSSFCKSRYCDD
ncbi:hypothetical protein Lser_V15G11232 [Lactuca serriola]